MMTRSVGISEFPWEDGLKISMLAHPIWCGAFLTLVGNSALAQDSTANAALAYPTKSVRILVGYAAGGGLDVIARLFAQKFIESMGQTFLVDNRPGAGGNIATDLTAKAVADGHTLIMAGSSHAINVSLYSKLPYDAVKDFAPISLVAIAASVLVPVGISTLAGDVVTEPIRLEGNLVRVPDGPGWGFTLDEDKIRRLRADR